MVKRLTYDEIYKKAKKGKWSDEKFRDVLWSNGIITKKDIKLN